MDTVAGISHLLALKYIDFAINYHANGIVVSLNHI
jgi:hypothetical protein